MSDAVVPLRVHKISFGDSELADAVIVVGDTEFHVHKMILANNSKYFKSLFFSAKSAFQMNGARVEIEAQPSLFQDMLNIIYHKWVEGEFWLCHDNLFDCLGTEDSDTESDSGSFDEETDSRSRESDSDSVELCDEIRAFWRYTADLLKYSEVFDVADVRRYVEERLARSECNDGDDGSECLYCVHRQLFAVTHDMDRLKIRFNKDFLVKWCDDSTNWKDVPFEVPARSLAGLLQHSE